MKTLTVVLQNDSHSFVVLQLLSRGFLLQHRGLDEVLLRLIVDVGDGSILEPDTAHPVDSHGNYGGGVEQVALKDE